MTKAYEYNKKWRVSHPTSRASGKQRNYAQTQGAPNTKKEWTTTEIQRILEDGRPSDRELAAELGRSMQAIQHKRYQSV